MSERYSYILSETDEIYHIRELLKRRLHFSSRLLRQLKKQDCVFLDGTPVWLRDKGKAGQTLTVTMPKETSHFEPEPIPIDVIFEDEDIMVVNKQPGLVVHPTKGHPCHTIANGIMSHMLEKGDCYKIRFVNRLDMDTSGILLIGKNSHAQDNLAKQMAESGFVSGKSDETDRNRRTVEKKYVAIVKGMPEEEEGTIDLPIGKPVDDQLQRAVIPDGSPSVTHYRVLERYPKGKTGYALVELMLETGRTHQIRVHLSHIGYPIVGDHLYGEDAVYLIERQALHAAELSFLHPATKKRVTFRAPLPEDMKNLIRRLESRER